MCVLNGRGDKSHDNFTYVSTLGRSVVDYVCVPYGDMSKYSNFRVQLISDIMLENNILPDARATIPDHSMLSFELSFSYYSETLLYNDEVADGNL